MIPMKFLLSGGALLLAAICFYIALRLRWRRIARENERDLYCPHGVKRWRTCRACLEADEELRNPLIPSPKIREI